MRTDTSFGRRYGLRWATTTRLRAAVATRDYER
jgi:hypothetical protein